MDKFPEAFKRFESQRKIDDLDYRGVLSEFQDWQNGVRPTVRQQRAIKQQLGVRPRNYYKQTIHFSYGDRSVFRSYVTGRFVKGI